VLADDLVNLRWDGDVDVVVKAEDPGGRVVTVVVEASMMYADGHNECNRSVLGNN